MARNEGPGDRDDNLGRAIRLGYLARALLYAVMAVTALSVALGNGGSPTDSRGALTTLSRQPFGTALLAVITLGLVAYALWRAWQAITYDDDVSLPEELLQRGYYGGGAVLYGLLGWTAARITFGSGGSGGGKEDTMLAKVLQLPFGKALGVAVGLGVLAYAGFQGHRALTQAFEDDLDLSRVDGTRRRLLRAVGMAGYAARFVVFGLVGVFVVVASWTFDPERARGFDGALSELASQPYGPWLLGAVALGLLAFGLFSAAQARYRRVEVDG